MSLMDWVATCVLEPLWFGRREKASDDDHGDDHGDDDEEMKMMVC